MNPVAPMRLTKIDDPNKATASVSADRLAVEGKLDGWSIQAIFAGGPRIYSRRGKNITQNFPEVVNELVKLNVPEQSSLLGELVWLDENNKQSITTIGSLAGSSPTKAKEKKEGLKGHAAIIFYDVLWLNGEDVTKKPFRERREALERLLDGKTNKVILLSPMRKFDDWKRMAQWSLASGGEGVVIKNLDSPYVYSEVGEREPKPADTWWKWKPPKKAQADDFVVYNSYHTETGKLMVEFGQYHEGKLYHVGRIDSFSSKVESEIEELIANGDFVIEMGFEERTADGKLRHPHFLRVRPDKDAKDVDLPPEFADTLSPAKGTTFESRLTEALHEVLLP
jgi:ATP-dependent DNA ligase